MLRMKKQVYLVLYLLLILVQPLGLQLYCSLGSIALITQLLVYLDNKY